MRTVGFVAPPDWRDPSPGEFGALKGVRSIGVSLDLDGFDWTPFGWAGLDADERPHDRNARIAAGCGAPVVSAVSGVLDWLEQMGARRVVLAATYYDDDWCGRWQRFVTAAGFTVSTCVSMADLSAVGSRGCGPPW